MFRIETIYDNLDYANIEGLKWALLSVKGVNNVVVDNKKSTVYIYSEKRKIREELLQNAAQINGCSFRTVVERIKI